MIGSSLFMIGSSGCCSCWAAKVQRPPVEVPRLFAASTKASDVVGAPYIRHMDNAVWRALPHIKFIRPRDCGQHTIETNDNIKTKPFEDNSARFF